MWLLFQEGVETRWMEVDQNGERYKVVDMLLY